MRSTVIKYGLIAGTVMSAVMLVPFALQDPDSMLENMGRGEVVGYATMVVAMGLVFFALREHRDRNLGGTMRFRTGLLTGLAVTLVAALTFGLATAGMYAWIGPEETDRFMRAYVGYSMGPGATPEALATAIAEYESQRHLWLNPFFQGFIMFATVVPIGLVVSLVSAVVLGPRRISGS